VLLNPRSAAYVKVRRSATREYYEIFMIDFVYRILTASSKSGYFFRRFGWADLLASLPF
jgi:hypothetical protein